MRILLIGGNGFIGLPLTQELRRAGHQVAILCRSSLPKAVRNVDHIPGDRNRLSSYRDRLRELHPDVIVDLILSSGEQARELINVVSQIGGRVVVLSSADVYRAWGVLHGIEGEELEPLPITENSRLRTTRKLYSADNLKMMQSVFNWVNEGYDKIAVEETVMSRSGLAATVLRLPMVYGPGDPLHRFFPVLKRTADGRPAIILPDDSAAWRGPRGYVENVAHAIAVAAASEDATGRIYNVCEEPCFSELEWQTSITKHTEWSGRLIVLPRGHTPKHLLFSGNASQHVVVSSKRIRAELGYEELVPRDEAIERTIAWEQANPPGTINPQQFDYAAEDGALANAGLSGSTSPAHGLPC